MKKPNFFIIGAPKCGTTSLAAWLSEHPQIFMSPVKEVHHFITDENRSTFRSLQEYEQLFIKANESHKAVGEASVWYLYSNDAVQNIERYAANARYIVCLRNPVEMAYSLHEQQLVNGNEHITEFAKAWSLNNARLRSESVNRWCHAPRHLAYGTACQLGQQLERLYTRIPRERVLPILLDDMKLNPRTEYLKVLDFLGVDDDARTDFPVHNPAKALRSPWVRKMIKTLGHMKRSVGLEHGFGILRAVNRANIRYRARSPMTKAMSQTLESYFLEDIQKLGRLINRDLSYWLKATQAARAPEHSSPPQNHPDGSERDAKL